MPCMTTPEMEEQLAAMIRNLYVNQYGQADDRQIAARGLVPGLLPNHGLRAARAGGIQSDTRLGSEDSAAYATCPEAPQPDEVPSCSFTAFGGPPTMMQGPQAQMPGSSMPGLISARMAMELLANGAARPPQGLGTQAVRPNPAEVEHFPHGRQSSKSKESAGSRWSRQSTAATEADWQHPEVAPSDLNQMAAWQSNMLQMMQREAMRFPQRSASAADGPIGQRFRGNCPPGLGDTDVGLSPSRVAHQINNVDLDDSHDEEEVEGWCPPMQVTGTGPKTTLMVRNIPVMYTQEMLLMEWPNNNTYDFLYLPYSCSMQRNLTYAFINFTSTAAACEFKAKWQKMRLAHYMARKPLNISFADLQGRDDNLLQLKKKRFWRIKIKQCQPIIFENGERISLAQALHKLEANDAQMFSNQRSF